MLNLQSCIHFHKVVLIRIQVKNKLDCACIIVSDCFGCIHCWIAYWLSDYIANVRWSLLHDFLVSSLNWTISLEQMNVIFVFVSEYLHFDVSGSSYVFLYNDSVVFECFQWLSFTGFKSFIKLLFFMNNSHSFTSTSWDSFNQNRKANFLRLLIQIFGILIVLMIAGHNRHIGSNHNFLRLALTSHTHNSRRRWSDK